MNTQTPFVGFPQQCSDEVFELSVPEPCSHNHRPIPHPTPNLSWQVALGVEKNSQSDLEVNKSASTNIPLRTYKS